jgi:hypothetical protein
MKKLIVLLLLLLSPSLLLAQEKTLFSGNIESGGYGGFFTKIGQINGGTGVFIGGQGAWIINHSFGIGAKGYGLVNEVAIEGQQNTKLKFGCWGGLLEYIISSDKLLHLNIHAMIGAGGVRYDIIDYQDQTPTNPINYSDDGLFVLEPGLDLILNVNKKFRIGIGAAYRVVSGVSYESLSNSDLSGISGQVVLKFGVF